MAISRMTSQVKDYRQKSWEKAVLTREEKVAIWQQALGTQTIQNRISQVLPETAKSKKKVIKKGKTAGGNKEHTGSTSSSRATGKHRRRKRRP